MLEVVPAHPRWTLKERLEHHSMPVPMSGCWLWCAKCSPKGYGQLLYKGTNWQAHRAAWSVWRGDIPGKMQVLHKCDVPSCINPDHLFLGTNDDNVADRVAKGRSSRQGGAKGEDHALCVLSWEQVEDIRSSNKTQQTLADEFGTSRSLIGLIRQGKRRVAT